MSQTGGTPAQGIGLVVRVIQDGSAPFFDIVTETNSANAHFMTASAFLYSNTLASGSHTWSLQAFCQSQTMEVEHVSLLVQDIGPA